MLKAAACVAMVLTLHASQSMAFDVLTVDDFPMMDSYGSVDVFQRAIRRYESSCLEHSFSGSLGQRCFMKRQLWGRELQHIYKSIAEELPENMQHVFEKEQQAWETSLSHTESMAMYMIGRQYSQSGTMYVTARVKSLDDMVSNLIRHRVISLREWHQDFLMANEDQD